MKRRHVYRVAAAYAVIGWLLIQVATQVFPVFHLPDWIEQAVVLVILVGFPIALVLAWAFDATPAGIVRAEAAPESGVENPAWRRSRRTGVVVGLIGIVLAAAAGFAWWHLRAPRVHSSSTSSVSVAAARSPDAAKRNSGDTPQASGAAAPTSGEHGAPANAAAQPIPAKSIAVLPFENLSTDKGNAYFADGMQDLILTKLADIGDLKVISRTSTEKYKSHPDDLKTIGQQLGVATILEGSVQKAGNQVLINVQLIDAKTDGHIWAQSYQRTLDNIFGVEGEVAEKVAEALNAKLTMSEKLAVAKAPTHNKQALDDYLRGQYYLNHETATLDPAELKQSIALLEQATRLDPGFVSAFSGLSLAYQHLGGHDKQAEIAAKRALALSPHNANAHRMVAYVLAREGNFEQALEQAKEAVRLAPTNAIINNGLGNVYDSAGQHDKAIAIYRHALELDSKQNFIRINLGSEYMEQRRYADARDVLQTATMVDPSSVLAAIQLAWVQELGWGDLAAARKALQGVPTPVTSSGALADAWYWIDLYARDYPAALTVIRKAPATLFENQQYPLALYKALVYQAQGDDPRARAAFAKAQVQIETWLKGAPGSAASHASLSLTLAGLGQGDDAVTQAQRAVKLAHASSVNQYLLNLAAIDAQTGKTDAALKLLDDLCSKPSGDAISASLLRLDPAWNPIRNDPRFQELLEQYAAAEAAAVSSGTGSAGSSHD